MVRKLAHKGWEDRIPDSANAFLSTMVILSLVAAAFRLIRTIPPEYLTITKIGGGAMALAIMAINDFIFIKKDKYKTIVEYFDRKYFNHLP